MDTNDSGAVAAWLLNTLGSALLAGMAFGALAAGAGALLDATWLIWTGVVIGPTVAALVLLQAKVPAQDQAPTVNRSTP